MIAVPLQIVLCAVCGGGGVGVSYYCVDTGQLYLMNDKSESDDYALFKRGD